MRVQTGFKAIAASSLLSVLVACGGGGFGSGSTTGSTTGTTTSGETTGTTTGGVTPTGTPAHINLVVGNGTAKGDGTGVTYALVATVTDANNDAVANATVTFSSTTGSLAVGATASGAASTLTDTSGDADATLTLPNNEPAGNYMITAKVSVSLISTATITVSAASNLALGVLAGNGTFKSGQITIGQSPLAASGSSSIAVSLVDTSNSNALYTNSTTVSFTSPCIASGNATITSPVTSTTGNFDTTYVAKGCSGNDTITATAAVSGSPSASGTIVVSPASLGSLQFTSPTSAVTLGLKGTGLNETQAVVFTVLDSNGNPVANQSVSFSLSTSVGGISLSTTSASSGSNGTVSTIISSGTVHTSVRVIASATKSDGTVLSTQSNQITVSTGYPAQNAMSLSAVDLNLVGNEYDGNPTKVNVRMSDRYGNPPPAGTAVAFTAECGQIQSSCTTDVNGACFVTFTTQNPRTSTLVSNSMATPAAGGSCSAGDHETGCDDHRCSILATAIGEESFVDCNGTGEYVSAANPANNSGQCPNGDLFTSLGEAFLDANENGTREGSTETYVDFNQNGSYDAADGKFIGLLCNSANGNCDTSSSLDVRQSLVIVMSSNSARASINEHQPCATTSDAPESYTTSNATPSTFSFFVYVGDTACQPPASGTTVTFALKTGSTAAVTPASDTIPVTSINTAADGGIAVPVTITPPTTATQTTDVLTVTVTVPQPDGSASIVTTDTINITYGP